MNWNTHSDLAGSHAFLGASKYYWLGYSDEKLADSYTSFMAAQRGTELHDFAAHCIRLRQRLPKKSDTLNAYVNDAIDFKMTPEQTLFYSHNCFGTADAISFRASKLRIHDLKTGATPARMEQLMIYAALFCLEYRVKPADIKSELRIYQSDEILYHRPEPEEIASICDRIVRADSIIAALKEKAPED